MDPGHHTRDLSTSAPWRAGLAWLMLLLVHPCMARGGAATTGRAIAGPVRTAVTVVRLVNESAAPVTGGVLRLAVPVTGPYQQVLGVRFSPAPTKMLAAPGGDRVAEFALPVLAPGQVLFAVSMARCRLRLIRGGDRAPIGGALRSRCLSPGPGEREAATDLAPLAATLRGGLTRPGDVALAVSSFLVAGFRYELDDNHDDAPLVLSRGTGSCTELSRLFVALVRRCDLPARFASGSRMRGRFSGYVDTVHHRWVEVHAGEPGWVPVDVSRQVTSGRPGAFVGVFPAMYLAMSRSPALPDDPIPTGHFVSMSPSSQLEREVRTIWYDDDVGSLPALLDQRLVTPPEGEPAFVDAALAEDPGPWLVPVLGVALYRAGDPDQVGLVIDKLVECNARCAVPVLVDYAMLNRSPELSRLAVTGLERLTGLTFADPAGWREWMRGEGLAYLSTASEP